MLNGTTVRHRARTDGRRAVLRSRALPKLASCCCLQPSHTLSVSLQAVQQHYRGQHALVEVGQGRESLQGHCS